MKYLAYAAGMFAIITSFCCSPNQPKTAKLSKREFVNKLNNETVALVKIDGEDTHTYCTGVWVSEKQILTARHCVESTFVFYKNFEDATPRLGSVVDLEENDDLALIEAIGTNLPKHPYAPVSNEAWSGEHVNIVGHTIGMTWSYVEGVVSATRNDIMTESLRLTLQISSPAWFGNSGGGAFDDEGRLVGICSFVSRKAPLMTFFTHPTAINSFLEKNKEVKKTSQSSTPSQTPAKNKKPWYRR